MYDILKDAYSFDERYAARWDENWKETDAFFFDDPGIADRYGFVTCYQGEPIGFICWDPRNRPEYVEIGHNSIRTKYKGRGFGKAQLSEVVRRIKEYEGLKEIRVCTNSDLIAPRNYESVGFVLYDRKENHDAAAFSGEYLYYKLCIGEDTMKIGEVCLLTNDVPRLASFYKRLLEVENNSDDPIHQFVLTGETALTIYNDGTVKNDQNQNICLAFTVEDMDKAYRKVLALGARITEPPAKRPWGTTNMSFYDPDNNVIYFRCFFEK